MDATRSAAYAGGPVKFAPADVFTWLFSSPFQTESDFTPRRQLIPPVEDERPIFVDELSGELSRHTRRQTSMTDAGSKTAH